MADEMLIRPYGRRFVPAPTGSESAEFDRWAIEEGGVPQPVLMEKAGRSAAALVQHLWPTGDVLALVGSGNNGGDALVALRCLAEWGRTVRAVLVADRDSTADLLHDWPVEILVDEDVGDELPELAGTSVLIDGILGTGIRGEPRERQARAIDRMNRAPRPVLALDIPSGVDGDTGAVPGIAVDADVTVTFGFPKLGALLHPGRARVGRLVAVDIGFPPLDPGRVGARALTPAWASAHRPVRALDTHKNAVGTLLLMAGSEGMAGAAVLAARAALRAGTGLVRVASAPANRVILQSAVPEAIFVDADDPDAVSEALEASTAVGAGPGMGTDGAAETRLARVLDGPPLPLLLDADGLNLLARDRPRSLEAVADARPLVVTPHPGEMERISGVDRDDLAADRVGRARDFAEESGAVLLLKGMPSLVASPDGGTLVDSVGTSDLATGGMGDVLTGTASAFLAQGCEPEVAAGLALHVSGRAAVLAGRGPGLLPSDVPPRIPDALREEGPGDTDLPMAGVLFDQDPAR